MFSGTVRGDSLLLTLGDQLLPFRGGSFVVEPEIGSSVSAGYEAQQSGWRTFDLHALTAVLVSVHEFLRLPPYLAGAIGTLSHVARLGLFSHLASPFIGPRYSGKLCMELFNVSGHVIRLRERLPIAKVVLFRTESNDLKSGLASIPFFYNSAREDEKSDLRSKYYCEFHEGGQCEFE